MNSNYITFDKSKLSRILSGNFGDELLESGITDDYDIVSLAAGEFIPLHSSNRKLPIPLEQYNHIPPEATRRRSSVYSDVDEYDTISMAMDEDVSPLYSTIPQYLMHNELPPSSNCTKGLDDYDTMSLASADRSVSCYFNGSESSISPNMDIESAKKAHDLTIYMANNQRAYQCFLLFVKMLFQMINHQNSTK